MLVASCVRFSAMVRDGDSSTMLWPRSAPLGVNIGVNTERLNVVSFPGPGEGEAMVDTLKVTAGEWVKRRLDAEEDAESTMV